MSDYAQYPQGSDKMPGLLDDMTGLIDTIEQQMSRLEERLRGVTVGDPETSLATPEPAPENRLHGQVMSLRRISNRLEHQLQTIRL